MSDDEAFHPAAQLMITDLKTLRVVSDPLRMRSVEILRRAPATVKELGHALGIAPKKLYYHVNMLEQHALIRVVSTRRVSGIVEKRYRAAAYLFMFQDIVDIASSGRAPDEQSRYEVAAHLYDMTRDELRQSLRNGLVDLDARAAPGRALYLSWRLARLSPASAADLYARTEALVAAYEIADALASEENSTPTYRFLVSLFPTYPRGPRPDSSPTND